MAGNDTDHFERKISKFQKISEFSKKNVKFEKFKHFCGLNTFCCLHNSFAGNLSPSASELGGGVKGGHLGHAQNHSWKD